MSSNRILGIMAANMPWLRQLEELEVCGTYPTRSRKCSWQSDRDMRKSCADKFSNRKKISNSQMADAAADTRFV